MLSANNLIILNVSKIISNFFNPVISLLIYFIYFSTKNYSFQEAVHRFFPILIITIVPIFIWLFWNVKSGKYSNMDVSNREQRKSFYFFIELVILLYLGFEYFKNEKIDFIMLFMLILLLVMQLSNYFIKSSMHTAFNIFVSALFFSQSFALGCVWLGISFLVGITRIILKRHTPKEVFMGAVISIMISFAYLYTNIQINH